MTPAGVYEATFPSTTTMNGDTACDTITIIDDDVLEGSHDLSFQINRTSLPGITLVNASTTVTIEDNESKYKYLQLFLPQRVMIVPSVEQYILYFIVYVCKVKQLG